MPEWGGRPDPNTGDSIQAVLPFFTASMQMELLSVRYMRRFRTQTDYPRTQKLHRRQSKY